MENIASVSARLREETSKIIVGKEDKIRKLEERINDRH